jgi:hypothetical protein
MTRQAGIYSVPTNCCYLKRRIDLAVVCHMSFLDIDQRLFELLEHVEFDGDVPLPVEPCAVTAPMR